MRHTVASVERMLFTDYRLRGMACKGLRNRDNREFSRLKS
jgi:hypothetical protein